MKKYEKGEISSEVIGIALFIWAIGSWITHIVYCIDTQQFGLLIAGAIFFPIGMIHGTGLWFGFF